MTEIKIKDMNPIESTELTRVKYLYNGETYTAHVYAINIREGVKEDIKRRGLDEK